MEIKNWKIWGGSRYSDGHVPDVSFDPSGGKVEVDWCNLGDSNWAGGLRQPVLQSNTLNSFPLDLESRVDKIEAWIANVKNQLL